VDHLPPKGQQTVRYYGIYSNKSLGIAPRKLTSTIAAPQQQTKITLKGDPSKPIQILLLV